MVTFQFSPFPTLETDRILLRKLESKDALSIFEYQSNKENFPYVDMQVYTEKEEAQSYIKKMNAGVESNKWIIWAIADVHSDQILGTASIWNLSEEQRKGELGYGLFPSYRGKGLMSEALTKVVEYGVNTMGLKTIEAYTNSKNKDSIALLKNGYFIKKANSREANTYSGEPMDMVIYQRIFE
ncbi:GNAT family N-acetyltransferase [Rossellomorea aquimaris]|uniref:GNAT family N-acetyltransferase n=1 Tax=Rossellomorea aquimaris TaxID=189382 RepID=UPI0007D07EDF|nr:GNAT family N-acetyltransferase [Rossellomorea aquimaris]